MILSKSGIESIDLSALVENYRLRNELPKLVFLVPTNRSVRELRMQFIHNSATKAVHKVHIETLQSMAVHLLEAANQGLRVLDDAASFVFLRQAVNETKSEYFKPYKGEMPEGVQKRLLSVFAIWKRENITPASLLAEAEHFQSDYEKQKLREVVEIYECYQQKLRTTGYADIGEYLLRALAQRDTIESLFTSTFPGAEYIIVQGFSEFAALEVEFIAMLADISSTTLFLDFDYYLGNREIFGCLESVYKKFQTLGFVTVQDTQPARETFFIQNVKNRLFFPRQKEADARFKDSVCAFMGRTLEDEVQLIAREIKRLCTEDGVKPASVCVLVNLIEQYAPVVRDVFTAYGLPLNLTDRPYLRSLLPVIDILSYFEILNDDFYYKTIFRTFSAGFIPLEECSLYDLQWVAEKFNIIGGRKIWTHVLPRAEELCRRDELELYELERVKRVTTAIELIGKTLQPFRGEMTPAEFLSRTKELVAGFRFISVMKSLSVAEGGKVLGAVTGFLNTLTEVISLLELEYGEDIRRRLPFYLKNLQQALSFTRFTEREPERFGVTVTTPNEARGLSFDYVFVAGLFDGNFPARYTNDLFTPENLARTELKHLYEQQYAFYQSLERWTKRLYLSYPLKDDRQELMPSRFLAAFQKSFLTSGLAIPNEPNRIYARQELLKMIGKGECSPADITKSGEQLAEIAAQIDTSNQIDDGRRQREESFASFNGVLATDALTSSAQEKLAKEKDKFFSISQFESYAGCPYKYFSERVLRLEEVAEPEEEADVRIIGSILHDILYRFLSWCKQQNIVLTGCDSRTFAVAEEQLFRIAREVIDADNQHVVLSFWDRERILGVDEVKEQSILHNFLRYEQEPSLLVPALFETSFGMKDVQAEHPSLDIDGIRLRGKIDRIDISTDDHFFTVVDYKTGSAPKSALVEDGVSLQLPLYLDAARQIIERTTGKQLEPLRPEIYQLKTKVKALGRIYLGDSNTHKPLAPEEAGPEKLDTMHAEATEMMQAAREKIVSYNQAMLQGVFPVKPYKKAGYDPCRYCTFQSVCRIGELSD